jgi:hypothetical protein
MRRFSLTDHRITVTAEPFELQVPVNTTGFAWEPHIDPQWFVVSDKRVRPGRGFGASGQVIYELRALRRGHYTIKFALSAPFEKTVREWRTIDIDVV